MKKAVMYGAGNIGRGFIGQLFSESGYEVAFIDVNTEIVNKLNQDGKYPVRILAGEDTKEIVVSPVRAVNGMDIEKVAQEIAQADIMATAVGVNILPRIVKPIVEGLKKRWQAHNMTPFNIIICENLLDANHYLAQLIRMELDDNEKLLFEKLVGLVEASIGRMVPVMTPEMQEGDILRVCVEEYCELPLDRDAFKGELPKIKNMLPASPFTFYIQRKLFIHNMGHALTAYLGKLKGYNYIWEAIGDPYIKLAVLRAMQDSAIAMSREHGIKLETILDHVDDLIYRFGNRQLGDTVNRVGNDTKRKLSPNDRLVGAANLCASQGIKPVNVCLGIAAAMKFDSNQNGAISEVQNIINAEGPNTVLKKICGLSEKDLIWDIILELYMLFDSNAEINDIMEMTGEIKRRRAD
jgi:mannitol-1-phosphate 5-dehydrogenase